MIALSLLVACEIGITGGRISREPIAVTARAPLWTGEVEAAGYGLYSYLLFGAGGGSNHARRLAAASAYLSVIEDAEEATIRELSPRSINIFYAPLRSSSFRRDPLTTQEAAWLVTNYDYARARLLLNRIGEEGDDVFLVTYLEPLIAVEAPQSDRLLVQDLSLVPTELIELWIQEFRRQVRRAAFWDQLTLRHALLRVRSALPHVARYVAFFGAAAGVAWPQPVLAAEGPPMFGVTESCRVRS